jgi:chromosome segregation ATPase
MVELEKHLETRARAELTLKKRVQELEKASAKPPPAPAPKADAAELATLKARVAKLGEELEELRGENDFLNGEVARYQQRNKQLQTQIESLKES